MTDIVAQLSGLNPFRFNQEEDDDDKGDEITQESISPEGRGAPRKGDLRVSHAIRSFLVREKILSERDAGLKTGEGENTPALREMLEQEVVRIPPSLTDRSHPLSEYFISSSHNTYLLAHQLYGESSAAAYETAIRTGSRCVEIDAWDCAEDPEEPKVTHGFTLVSNVRFRAVCERIRYVFDREQEQARYSNQEPTPLMISLENHCGPRGQLRLVQIMKEVFGHRLLTQDSLGPSSYSYSYAAEEKDHVFTLGELGAKIVVIVEFHFPDEASAGGQGSRPQQNQQKQQYEYEYERRRDDESENGDVSANRGGPGGGDDGRSNVIIAELAALGVCAQSVKPRDNSWFDFNEYEYECGGGSRNGGNGTPRGGPHHHLINVSESGLSALLPTHESAIARHNARGLMRVYPKGTRITSSNLQAVPFWGVGAQICALNWQTFGTSNQLNRALFQGSGGYVLKPPALRCHFPRLEDAKGGVRQRKRRRRKLLLYVVGATDVPIVEERDEDDKIKPYLTCTLHTPRDYDSQGKLRKPLKRKTEYYRQHRFGFLHSGENPPVRDPIWDEVLEWEYDYDYDYDYEGKGEEGGKDGGGLTFLRMLIKSDDSWAPNPRIVVGAVRLEYVRPGWRFVRMMDMRGGETGCTLLVRFIFEDVD